jgi:two-component system phosphate regulon sensor histidine kinase PhoR
VQTSQSPDEVRITVADHGVGISRADLDRIFERFYVADRARSKGGGTGLGLSIARHIVEAHGGTIQASSNLGEGSTFTVALPRR